MNKFLLWMILLLVPFLASANDEMDRLEVIFPEEEKYYIHSYKYYIDSYDVSKLDQDILTTKSDDDIFENSIQALSKEKNWDKQLFLNFVEALRNGDTKKATAIYSKNWKSISPFLPTCCAFNIFLAQKPVEQGIVILTMWGNGQVDYSLEYLYYKDGYLHNIRFYTWFMHELDRSDKLEYCSNSDGSDQCNEIKIQKSSLFMRQLFRNQKRNADFNNEYNKFLEKIKKIHE